MWRRVRVGDLCEWEEGGIGDLCECGRGWEWGSCVSMEEGGVLCE